MFHFARIQTAALAVLLLSAPAWPQTAETTGGSGDPDATGDIRLWDGHVPQTRLHLRDLGIAPYDVIPAGQTAITSLLAHSDGRIYGGTTGEVANLFVFSPGHNFVFPLGTIPGEESVYHALVEGADRQIYVGTTRNVDRTYVPDEKFAKGTDWHYRSVTAQIHKDYAAYPGGHLFRYSPASARISFQQKAFRINNACPMADLGIPVPHEGIYTLLADRKLNAIYGITYPGSQLFRYDIATGKTQVVGRLSTFTPREEYLPLISKVLVQDAEGNVYASADRGRLVKYEPFSGKLERLEIRLPGLSGREIFNAVEAAVLHPSGIIYGGTTDGYVFAFCPKTGIIRNLGKPLMETRIRAMTVGLDGKIYGLGGRKGGVTRLFRYDVAGQSFKDLGMLEVAVVPYYEWKAFLFDSIATGADGSIFLGNSEHRSRLFIYNP